MGASELSKKTKLDDQVQSSGNGFLGRVGRTGEEEQG